MSKFSQTSRRGRSLFEPLEERRLMTTWGAFPKLIGQDLAVGSYPTINGAGTSIAILDSGINYNDPALGGGYGAGHRVIAGYDYVDNDNDPLDSDGHGTGLASVAAATTYTYNGATYQGVAPATNLIAMRVDDGTMGWGQEAPLVEQALQWIIAHRDQYNIVAVNMSFGTGRYTSADTLAPIADELQTLNQMGVMLLASSGNSGVKFPGTIEYPAADPNVYSVGAVDASDMIWKSTSRNAMLDILAPGVSVPLIYYLPASGQRDILAGSGTSFATAFITGMAALLKQIDPTLTTAEMMSIMQRSGAANFDGDKETAPYSSLTFSRLNINNALALTYLERDDAHENNDSMGAATALSFSNGTASLNNLKLLQADADFYKFTLGARADVTYALSLSGAAFTPSVDLLDAQGTLLKHLSASDHIRLLTGTYYLRVNAPTARLVGTYGVSVTQTPDDGLDNQTPQTAAPIALDGSGHGVETGLTLLGGVDDYFSIAFDGTRDVAVTINYGGASAAPSAQLLDANGNFIATIGAAFTRRLSAGRYLIRVSSPDTLDGTYGVSVSATTPIVVAAPGQNGLSNGIAYDAAGKLYMAYYDSVSNNLKYATRSAAGVWSSATVVDGGLFTGQYLSLTLDHSGLPGIAYYDASHADLKYAHFNGSSWAVMTVDATFTTGYYPSLRFDSLSRPVISYYSKTGGNLRIAAYAGGTWTLTTVDSASDVGRYSSLALNPLSGRWAIAYEDTGHGTFKYAEQGKNGWSLTTADGTTKRGGGYVSLAFNPKTSRPSFSYYDAYNANLKYAVFNGSAWSNQTIASKGSVGLYSSLLFDSSGNADVLYYNKGTDSVCRAKSSGGVFGLTQITTGGGRWISRASTTGRQSFAYLKGSALTVGDL